MTMHRVAALSFALLGLPSASLAQTVRGVVVSRADAPVPGVVVLLVDSNATVSARSLSNERGEFRLNAPRTGSYRLRTLRIGFQPMLSDVIVLRASDDVSQRLVLSNVQFSLDTVRVVDRNVCRMTPESAAATYAVWEQVRTALTATQLTGGGRNLASTTVDFERTLDPYARRILQQRSTLRSEYASQPWRSIPPDSLRRVGYVVMEGTESNTFYAPGLDMLVSNVFVEDHCFRLVTGKDKSRLGIAFEPTSERKRVAEIKGTLWLDRQSSELRALEFRYVNVLAELQQESGGDMEFVMMKDGMWAISRWIIRMPVVTRTIAQRNLGGDQLHVVEIRATGGELAVARRGNDTLWSRPPLALTGTVVDSASNASLGGARILVAGTSLESVTDARGRFTVSGVLPGQYTVQIRTTALDSVSAMHQTPLEFIDGATPMRIRVPSAAQIVALFCRDSRTSNPGIVLGTVELLGDSTPPKDAKVIAEWPDAPGAGTTSTAGLGRAMRTLETRTDARGNFRLCGVPVGMTVTVWATTDVANAAPVPIQIASDRRIARTELALDRSISRGAALVGVVLSDSTQLPIAGAEVAIPELGKSVRTSASGQFRLSDIPAGTQKVVVRQLGYGPLDTPIAFTANETVERRILLPRVHTIDSVLVTADRRDRMLEEFEEHRKLGFGHFFTRADLEKSKAGKLSDVLEQVPSVGMIHGRANHAWILSKRAFGESNMYRPADWERLQGLVAGCYARVFLDRQLMNPGTPTEPFDINTFSAERIEAIEFYASAAQTPVKYSGRNSNCGVVVIHTRR